MRAAFLLSALLAVSAGAQTLPYERVEPLGPPVPDGVSVPLSITDDGWSLIRSEAPNLTSPERYPYQFFFRSPAGELTRIPLDQNGVATTYPNSGVLSSDGRFAFILSGNRGLLRIDRDTFDILRYEFWGPRVPVLATDAKVVLGDSFGFSTMYLDTGIVRNHPVPDSTTFVPLGVTPDGGYAVYRTSLGDLYAIQDLATDETVRRWKPGKFTDLILGAEGRYAWVAYSVGDAGGKRLVRHDLLRGTEETFSYVGGKSPTFVKASARYLFLSTKESLVADDKNSTEDFYVFDRSTEKLSLLSTQVSGRSATGRVKNLYSSPDGSRTMFLSASPSASDLPKCRFDQLYARSASAVNTALALHAKRPSGGDGAGAVLSLEGKATLWLRSSAEEDGWTLRSVVDGKPTRVFPVSKTAQPLDVSDDGGLALWCDSGNRDLRFYRRGVVVPLSIGEGVGFILRARIDSKTGTPLALVQYWVNNASVIKLLRFDPRHGTAQQIDQASPIRTDDFSVAVGRAAWATGTGARVFDLASGTILDLPYDGGFNPLTPRLTADGARAAAFDAGLGATRVYRLPDGKPLNSLPVGDLLPDGQWMREYGSSNLIYLKTGARFRPWIEAFYAVPGELVGPEMVTVRSTASNVPFTGDVWRYRLLAASYPYTEYFYATPAPGGIAELRGGFFKAGLENAPTWLEYRVDSAGEWRRMKVAVGAVTPVKLKDGTHVLEARAVDSKGRVESSTTRSTVTTDAAPPTVGKPTITRLENGHYELTAPTDAASGRISITKPDGVTDTYGASIVDGVVRYTFTSTESGTYRFRFLVQDALGNQATSTKGTFTIE